MKRTIQGLLIAGTMVLGISAFAQQAGRPPEKKGTAEVRGFVVPTDEKGYLERLHHINQMEIKLGQLAQQNSTNPDVKSFGELMVRDHTEADQKLMSLAQSRGLRLSDTPRPVNDMEKKAMAAEKALMEELRVLRGDPFDSTYMAHMVDDHDEALGKLMAGRQALSGNAQITSLIDELTPVISRHRQQAYSVLGKLGESMMGVGGAGGTEKGTGTQQDSGHMEHMGTGGSGTQPKK